MHAGLHDYAVPIILKFYWEEEQEKERRLSHKRGECETEKGRNNEKSTPGEIKNSKGVIKR